MGSDVTPPPSLRPATGTASSRPWASAWESRTPPPVLTALTPPDLFGVIRGRSPASANVRGPLLLGSLLIAPGGVAGSLRGRPPAGEQAVRTDVDRGDEPRRERRARCLRAARGEMFPRTPARTTRPRSVPGSMAGSAAAAAPGRSSRRLPTVPRQAPRRGRAPHQGAAAGSRSA